jgi:hypothetical protein
MRLRDMPDVGPRRYEWEGRIGNVPRWRRGIVSGPKSDRFQLVESRESVNAGSLKSPGTHLACLVT